MKTRKFVALALSLGLAGCKTTSIMDVFSRNDRDQEATFAEESTRSRTGESGSTSTLLAGTAGGTTSAEQAIALGQKEYAAWERDHLPSRLDVAEGHFAQAVRLDPKNANAHHGLAIIADLHQDFTAAERHYRQALIDNPNDTEMLGNLGYSYLLQGRLAEAERTLNQSLAADPGNKNATRHLGDVYAQQGELQLAESMYRRVLNESQVKQALAAAQQQRGSGSNSPPAVQEPLEEEKSLLSRLRPKRETDSDLTAEIKKQMAEAQAASEQLRRQSETPGPDSAGVPAWAQNAPAASTGYQPSEAEIVKRQLARIDQEQLSRVPSGPIVVGSAAAPAPQMSVASWGAGTPAAGSAPPPASSGYPAQQPVVFAGSRGSPSRSDWNSGNPSQFPGDINTSAVTRAWGQVAPVAAANAPQAIDQAYYQSQGSQPGLNSSYFGAPNPNQGYPPAATQPSPYYSGGPDYSGGPAGNPLSTMPQTGDASASAEGVPRTAGPAANAYEEAARAAARLGMGLGHGPPPAYGDQTARMSAGTSSAWNGMDYASPQRMLPTDLPPQDLRQAYAPQVGTNMAPTPEAHGQYPAVNAPLHTPDQFGTASRYQTMPQYPQNPIAAPTFAPSLEQYDVQRQQADGQLNSAMQQAWERPAVNSVSPANGINPAPGNSAPPPWPHRPVNPNPYDVAPAVSQVPPSSSPPPARYGPGVIVPPPYGQGTASNPAYSAQANAYPPTDYSARRTSYQEYPNTVQPPPYRPAPQAPASSQMPQIVPTR